jgi:hypothetical protein
VDGNHLPQVELFSFRDGIHNLELQKPEEVANLIFEFLSKTHPDISITKSQILDPQ